MSKIEWTERTWNPVVGCTPVSPGCLNCYAGTMANRLGAMGQPQYVGLTVRKEDGRGDARSVFNGTVRCVDDALVIPLARKKPTVYFVCSMGDLFHEDVPDAFIDRVFAVMALCPQHTFQALTKRTERMAEYLSDDDFRWRVGSLLVDVGPLPFRTMLAEHVTYNDCGTAMQAIKRWPLPNVWLGTSAEDQARLDERVPHLLRCPAAVRFLSCEPLLGELDLDKAGGLPLPYATCQRCGEEHVSNGLKRSPCCGADMDPEGSEGGVEWVIVGGESGAHARPCYVEWIRSVVAQCQAAGVPVFVKQLGAVAVGPRDWARGGWSSSQVEDDGGQYERRMSDRKGGNPGEWPEDLRVRQTPPLRPSVSSVPSVVDR